ncbi:MAG: LTA synthase family protein [Terriglobia bacterium]|jgi:hypothetical protein
MNAAAKTRSARLIASAFRLVMRPEVTLGALVIALLFNKLKVMRPESKGPIVFAVIQHDAAIFALMVLLFAVGSSGLLGYDSRGITGTIWFILRKLCLVACVLLVLLYGADVFAFHFFTTRLYARDIVQFAAEPSAVFTVARSHVRGLLVRPAWKLTLDGVLIAVLLRACYLLVAKPARSRVHSRLLLAIGLPLVIFWLAPAPSYVYSFIDRPLYENFIECNHNFFVRNTFSDAFRARILAAPPPAEAWEAGRHRRLNVILVIVESLSAYQSHYFSGIENWTPRLDEIAERETALTNFFANGWTTTGGVVSLIAGTVPFVPELRAARAAVFAPMGGTSFTDYADPPRPLPRVLSEQGYMTEFVAPGDLKFVSEDKWLPMVGFQKVIGQDDPRYAGQKLRGPFDSVPDRLLFDVAFQESAQMPRDKPYFMVVQTFWSHTPFLDPAGGTVHLNGPEPVFRETDAQIGAFYDRLAQAGFFQNGLLFITGDHRAMDPYRKSEFKRFGDSAVARIPAVIATHALSLPKVISQGFQQRDFVPSIEALVGDSYCLGPWQGSFLSSPPKPPGCIMHAMGIDRDLVFVRCGDAEGTVRATGDATRFVSGSVPDEAAIIQYINRSRVRTVN